jgi:signal transduction histidine kinase
MSQHSLPTAPRDPDVFGELLHSLSQPLTGLLCSLELSLQLPVDRSIEQVAEQQQANVSVALQQTEKVIGMIQLMREYLDAEQPGPEEFSSALAPATRSVIEELSSIAAVTGVRLRLVGTCTATLPVPESRLRLALQYLITTLIQAEPVGGKVLLLLGEGPAGAVLRAEGERGCRGQKPGATSPQTASRRARIAIASRVLETAGASLVFGGGEVDPTGFVLRIPRPFAIRD